MHKLANDVARTLSLRRPFFPFIAALTFLLAITFLAFYHGWTPQHLPAPDTFPAHPEHPPLYQEWHQEEIRLPQHNWSKARPDEQDKIFFVGGHVVGAGWGNSLQEHLLNAYLSYRAGVAYVFDDYAWEGNRNEPYTHYGTNEIPSRIPYRALMRGPTVGDRFPDGDRAHLAVHRDYWTQICYNLTLRHQPKHIKSAKETIDTWTKVIHESSRPCVEGWTDAYQVFSHASTFGVRGSLADIFDDFLLSPMITHFGWSPLIELGFDLNRHFFMPTPTWEPYLSSTPFTHATTNRERYPMIPGLIVLHLRRGDYENHCHSLSDWHEDFVTWHTLPGMTPDPFTVPEPGAEHLWEHYRTRCYPSVAEIVQRVRDVRASDVGRGLERIYVMSNGKPPFLAELKAALARAGPWKSIATNRDLALSWEQKYVSQAVDQLAAQRAQVFIGNGFSTLTSHVVVMRKANLFPIASTRLW